MRPQAGPAGLPAAAAAAKFVHVRSRIGRCLRIWPLRPGAGPLPDARRRTRRAESRSTVVGRRGARLTDDLTDRPARAGGHGGGISPDPRRIKVVGMTCTA